MLGLLQGRMKTYMCRHVSCISDLKTTYTRCMQAVDTRLGEWFKLKYALLCEECLCDYLKAVGILPTQRCSS